MTSQQWLQRSGVTQPLLQTLAHSGQFETLLAFVGSRWETLEKMSESNAGNLGFSDWNLLHVAWACRALDRDDCFTEAMERLRATNDREIAAGVGWPMFWLMDAQYWMLANDQDKAIELLQKISDWPWVIAPRIARMYPLFKPLEGDPRFEAIQNHMREFLNTERSKAGMAPIEPEYRS